ncbi:MAG: hypothetical protein ACKPEN_01610 [Planktothrix sp.]|uniref:hypothetical protein n=1 Tax=Planktothrix sp. TaxID=3088171 RepID=UPI0038D4A657
MLTDRQIVAMHLLANTISNEADLVFMARSDRGTEKIINYALMCADKFLRCSSESETSTPELVSQLQLNNQKLQQINDVLDAQFLESTSGD